MDVKKGVVVVEMSRGGEREVVKKKRVEGW